MTFEEALRAELLENNELTNKIFPLIAPKDTKGAFLVYKRGNVNFKKVFSGTLNKVEANYDLTLIAESYSQLQQINTFICEKLIGFQGRPIGISGPFIENITVSVLGDQYEPEVDLYRTDFTIKVNY